MKYLGSALLSVLSIRFVAADYADNANSAINTLQDKYYNADTGLWKGAKGDMWWQSGNMVEAIARFGQQDADFKPTAIDIVSNTYAKSPNQFGYKNWINDYYDDEGWWALAWIAAHDLTGDIKYLNTAIDIFNDMTTGWGTSCNNGGVWWRKEKDSITSIANELFISVAAHIANRVGDNVKQDYVNWAENAWDWFLNSGVINGDNLINDGLDVATCKNNGATEYTYNQGVILGGLSELARAKSDGGFIDHADTLAGASTTKMTRDNGILTELVNDPVGTKLDEQGAMFKGAYIRGLATLNVNNNNKYADFLKKNADSVWDNARNGDGVIEDKWQGGDDNVSASTQASGIDVLVAAAAAS